MFQYISRNANGLRAKKHQNRINDIRKSCPKGPLRTSGRYELIWAVIALLSEALRLRTLCPQLKVRWVHLCLQSFHNITRGLLRRHPIAQTKTCPLWYLAGLEFWSWQIGNTGNFRSPRRTWAPARTCYGPGSPQKCETQILGPYRRVTHHFNTPLRLFFDFYLATVVCSSSVLGNGSARNVGPQCSARQYVREGLSHLYVECFPTSNARFGALYVGVLVSAVLFGLCLLQAFLYFQSPYWCAYFNRVWPVSTEYKEDLWYIKVAVSFWIASFSLRISQRFGFELCRW